MGENEREHLLNITYITGISQATGMCASDIAYTLQSLNMLGKKDGKCVLAIDHNVISNYVARVMESKHPRLEVDEEYLRWTPLVSNSMLMEEEWKTEQEVGAWVGKKQCLGMFSPSLICLTRMLGGLDVIYSNVCCVLGHLLSLCV